MPGVEAANNGLLTYLANLGGFTGRKNGFHRVHPSFELADPSEAIPTMIASTGWQDVLVYRGTDGTTRFADLTRLLLKQAIRVEKSLPELTRRPSVIYSVNSVNRRIPSQSPWSGEATMSDEITHFDATVKSRSRSGLIKSWKKLDF